ncbi:MAG: hypothetical protein JWR80_7551 [Bradyrhizobium sp.]|nr:hypothetical protein [Bradyrhizobium sp.]
MDRHGGRPRRIAVFGASGHLGGPLARYVRASASDVTLRLLSSSEAKGAALRADFPDAEVMVANYLDPASMMEALAGVEGVFLVTPNFLDEDRAMPIFITAARAGGVTHIVRLLGDAPGMTLDRMPAAIRDFNPPGPATQHLVAHSILEASGLPVTFINCASYMMDNFMGASARGLRASRTLMIPVDRLNSFIDPRDVGETAACLLLGEGSHHIGRIYDLDNGQDLMRFSQVAELMGDVFGEPIGYDGSHETFLRENGDHYRKVMNNPRAPDYMLAVWEFEREIEALWRLSNVVETIIGRKPMSLRAWLIEHRDTLLPRSAPAAAWAEA